MNPINKPNFFVFTGGPGTGKTTLLDELSRQGYAVVPEVARAIIKKQHAMGGNATHTGDRKIYCDLMLQQSITDFVTLKKSNETVFFDRGIVDLYSYTKQFCGGVRHDVLAASKHYRYHPHVFLFPPWPEIYCHDEERKQSFETAVDTYHSVKESYTACGYQLIEVPKCSVTTRANFILQSIRRTHDDNYRSSWIIIQVLLNRQAS